MKEQEQFNYIDYAKFLERRFNAGILTELMPYAQFVVWKRAIQNGKRRKPPFNPLTNELASPTDPQTWGTLEESLRALRSGHYQGIGFVFSKSDPFTGVDIDHCILNETTLTQRAGELVRAFSSYTELSPSRTGLHILVKGSIPEGRHQKGIEVYSTERYFTITTNRLKGSPQMIEARQAQLDRLYASLTPEKPPPRVIKPQEQQLFLSDTQVLEKAQNAANGHRFSALYNGDMSGFASKSEADFTLALYLLYWTKDDVEQTRRLFLQSGLADEKTLRPTAGTTYLEYTIQNALKKRIR